MALMIPSGGGGGKSPADITSINGFSVDWPSVSAMVSHNVSNFNYPVILGKQLDNCASFFASLTAFNQPVTIPKNVNNCYQMFSSCKSYNQPMVIPDNVNAVRMFQGCDNMNSPVVIGNNVNADNMFQQCNNFNSVVSFGDNVNASCMFYNCINIGGDIRITGNNVIVNAMFFRTGSKVEKVIPSSGVTSLAGLFSFSQYNKQFNIPVGVQDVSNLFTNDAQFNSQVVFTGTSVVKDCSNMFTNCNSYNLPIYMPQSVENCSHMFNRCPNFNQAITLYPNMTNVVNMFAYSNMNSGVSIPTGMTTIAGLFAYAQWYNRPVTIPASVTNISSLFEGATRYNQEFLQPIPSQIKDISKLYWQCGIMGSKLSSGTSNFVIPNTVTNFYGVFGYTGYFLLNKITPPSNVTSWHGLYAGAILQSTAAFTVNIPAKVTDCSCLFESARSDFANVNVNLHENIVNCSRMFAGVGAQVALSNILIEGGVGKIIPKNAKDCSYMFSGHGLKTAAQGRMQKIGNPSWSGGTNVENCSHMFDSCPNLNGASAVWIGNKVTDCSYMFNYCLNFYTGVNLDDATNLKNCSHMFASCHNFTMQAQNFINIPNSVTDCTNMFYSSFRASGSLTAYVKFANNNYNSLNCAYMFGYCSNLTTVQPLTKFPMGTVNCAYAFIGCHTNFATYLNIPNTVNDVESMYQSLWNLAGNIFFYPTGNVNMKNFISKNSAHTRLNIYCANINMFVNTNVRWWNVTTLQDVPDLTPITNGYYNSQYNLYLYNNIPAWTD